MREGALIDKMHEGVIGELRARCPFPWDCQTPFSFVQESITSRDHLTAPINVVGSEMESSHTRIVFINFEDPSEKTIMR